MRVEPIGLIIGPDDHPSIGTNIQGPSLLRVPDFVERPLGRYYLYFADHKGDHIRLAVADEVTGPYRVHPGGVLHLAESHFLVDAPTVDDATIESMLEQYERALGPDKMPTDAAADMVTPHIASPDVHVDHQRQELVMYFHGLDAFATQRTRTARSHDGVGFTAASEITVANTYLRVFDHRDQRFGLAMPGQCYRVDQATGRFVEGPRLFDADMRHCGVLVDGDELEVYWSRVGDDPERILLSVIDVRDDFDRWRVSDPVEVHRPLLDWEGAGLDRVPSRRGAVHAPANELRDPYPFIDDDGTTFLLYAAAGESGIGLARLTR